MVHYMIKGDDSGVSMSAKGPAPRPGDEVRIAQDAVDAQGLSDPSQFSDGKDRGADFEGDHVVSHVVYEMRYREMSVWVELQRCPPKGT